MIRKWSTDNKALNQKCINEVVTRLRDIDDTEEVGVIAAQDIIDIVLENMGPEIYDKAIMDVSKLLDDKFQEATYSVEDLKQS